MTTIRTPFSQSYDPSVTALWITEERPTKGTRVCLCLPGSEKEPMSEYERTCLIRGDGLVDRAVFAEGPPRVEDRS